MTVIVAGFPMSVGVARHVFLALGSEWLRHWLSTTVGTVAVAGSMFYLNRRERQLLAAVESERALLRANSDGMLDSQALLEAVRDHDGQVVDFICRSANRALCSYLGRTEQDLLGRSASEDAQNFEASGLMKLYVQCVASGEPIMLDDLPRFNQAHDEVRHYDLRLCGLGPSQRHMERRDRAVRGRRSDQGGRSAIAA